MLWNLWPASEGFIAPPWYTRVRVRCWVWLYALMVRLAGPPCRDCGHRQGCRKRQRWSCRCTYFTYLGYGIQDRSCRAAEEEEPAPDAGRAVTLEEAARVAEAEPELPGEMPYEVELAAMQDIPGVLRATVRTTKRNIAAAIRALASEAPGRG